LSGGGGGGGGAAACSAARPEPQQRPAPSPSPNPAHSSGLGHVIASASNYVRVEMHTLLPEHEATPPGWRPPHLRPPAAAAGASTDPAAVHASLGSGAPPPPAASASAAASNTSAADDEGGATRGSADGAAPPPPPPRRLLLLCSVRSLLRKLRQDVVVGDVVRVSSIDWREGRGVVSEVLPRSSRLVDPAVANVDHMLLVFALDTPPHLAACFPELAAAMAAQPCRFSDCLHVAEPGCSVRAAAPERYLYYRRFLAEMVAHEETDVRQLQRAKAEREGYAKVKSVRGGGERLEARLDSKKHRRASRHSAKHAGRMAGGEAD
ncbi:putative ribosome biogenesis GTPase RsgA, partial [Tetrabaena socialis]